MAGILAKFWMNFAQTEMIDPTEINMVHWNLSIFHVSFSQRKVDCWCRGLFGRHIAWGNTQQVMFLFFKCLALTQNLSDANANDVVRLQVFYFGQLLRVNYRSWVYWDPPSWMMYYFERQCRLFELIHLLLFQNHLLLDQGTNRQGLRASFASLA